MAAETVSPVASAKNRREAGRLIERVAIMAEGDAATFTVPAT
jgi:hypothetical protein